MKQIFKEGKKVPNAIKKDPGMITSLTKDVGIGVEGIQKSAELLGKLLRK